MTDVPHTSDRESEVRTRRPATATPPSAPELSEWLVERAPSLTENWVHEIAARGDARRASMDDVRDRFATEIVEMLPLTLGGWRHQVEPLWDRLTELFGAVAAKRNLAAGEPMEELHILRELVIRDLYRDERFSGSAALTLREVLRLNRSLDRATTHASVGHTDALFFEFFEGDAGNALLEGEDVAAEATAQLAQIRHEVELVVAHARATPASARPEA